MRVTSKGQVTIPVELRRKYGITPDVEVKFEDTERGPVIVVVESEDRAESLRRHLENITGTLRGVSTEEVMRATRGEDWGRGDVG